MRVRVLVNPTAGGGSAARKLPAILREIERAGALPDSAETRAQGDAARLVRAAAADGVDCVAIVGGDGTLNEAAQAFIDAEGHAVPGPALALIPCGTGGDFRRTFGIGDSIEEAVARLVSSPARPIDLGALELIDAHGQKVVRAFINITSFGLAGLTDRIVNSTSKWLGGRASFFVGALRAMAQYRNAAVRVSVDGRPFLEQPVVNVAIANGRFFGGGMRVAPDADPSDGSFEVVAVGDLSTLGNLGLAGHIYKGTHVTQPGVTVTRGREIRAEPLVAGSEVLIDMDGETPGRLPLVARVLPGAVRLRA